MPKLFLYDYIPDKKYTKYTNAEKKRLVDLFDSLKGTIKMSRFARQHKVIYYILSIISIYFFKNDTVQIETPVFWKWVKNNEKCKYDNLGDNANKCRITRKKPYLVDSYDGENSAHDDEYAAPPLPPSDFISSSSGEKSVIPAIPFPLLNLTVESETAVEDSDPQTSTSLLLPAVSSVSSSPPSCSTADVDAAANDVDAAANEGFIEENRGIVLYRY